MSLDCVQVLGLDKLCGRHICRRGENTHRGRIAGTLLELLTVCQGQVDASGQAEVDEVVRRRQGWFLSCGRVCRPILLKVGANDP